MITPETIRYRKTLQERQVTLNQLYWRFRELALEMVNRQLVRYNRESHHYENCIHTACRRVSIKERESVAVFMQLQRNIQQQAMLLLEFEHTIKQQEERNEAPSPTGQTQPA